MDWPVPYSLKPQQSVRLWIPFAYDNEANYHKKLVMKMDKLIS